MTDLPPGPPTDPPGFPDPPPPPEERASPGFFSSAAFFLAGMIVFGMVSGLIAQLFGGSEEVAGSIAGIMLLGVIVWGFMNRRVGVILLKGFLVWVGVGAVLFGACLAILAGMY